MRAIIQRVTQAQVQIDENLFSEIGNGLLVLLGIEDADSDEDLNWLAQKIVNLRVFNDENGVMNISLIDANFDILLVSQFTLFASTKKGNRPSYIKASRLEFAIPLYEKMFAKLEDLLGKKIATGTFGADMQISLTNNGPVTIMIDSKLKE
ncbi:MAG: D-tyrosyl-tRNA(Tyr) deacylase [Bacteroidia bacterium]|nr:D-tyrosyl-tRNA(Tyr) deacylase [Bacteroidia bacterium]